MHLYSIARYMDTLSRIIILKNVLISVVSYIMNHFAHDLVQILLFQQVHLLGSLQPSFV